MKTSTSSNKSFFKGMAIYAAIFLILAFIGFIFFWFWINGYEKSRPSSTVEKYIKSLDYKHVQSISSDIITDLEGSSGSEEETVNALLNILKSSNATKSAADSTENEQVYFLKYNGSYVERITLKPSSKSTLGFTPWLVCEEKLIKENILSSSTISVPETWTVSYNGRQLGSEDLTGNKEEYEMLSGFYSELPDLPYIVEYTAGLHFGEVEIQVYDEQNNYVSKDDLTQERFSDNCTEVEKAKLKDFCDLYIFRYVNYTSYGVANGMGTYFGLLELISKESPLYSNVVGSLQGFGYASSLGDDVLDVRVPHCMNVGNNTYVCDIEYDLKTYGRHHTITEETLYMRLAVKEIDGELKAIAYINY